MENPYATPSTNVLHQDPRVISWLVEHQYKLKVIRLLRKEGMRYDEAKALVQANVPFAEKILNRRNRKWKIIAWSIVLTAVFTQCLIHHYQAFSFLSELLVAVLCIVSMRYFSKYERINF